MEFKYGLLCSTGDDICTYGQFPLLASTESLLGKLGFELCEPDNGSSGQLLGSLIHPCENTSPNDDTEYKEPGDRLADSLLIALDDVRDLRHRTEDKEPTVSRRSKDFKVQSLEKSRAKMLEQQQNKTDAIEEDNSQEIRQAWVRLVRVVNSARLLLFLFSQEQGLNILSSSSDNDIAENGIRNVRKVLSKLADALELLSMSSSEYDANGQPLTTKEKSKWEQFVQTGVKSRESNPNDNEINAFVIDLPILSVNESIIDLTDDSSVESEGNDDNVLDDLSARMMENAIDNENPPLTIPAEQEENKTTQNKLVPERCVYWNTNLTNVMNGLISIMKTNIGTEPVRFLKQSFFDKNANYTVRQQKASRIDKHLSLIVGVHGSKEYQKRKQYLLAIERLRQRVEYRIRLGKKGHEFDDAHLDVYGSCLSGLSLGKNADVDLSLSFSLGVKYKQEFDSGDMTAKKYSRHVKHCVFRIKSKLERSPEFTHIEAVPNARVPVIKGIYLEANNPHSEDGSLHFDICLLNDIAVANSGLIKEYSDMDIRIKSLMIAVKKWTKDNKINSAQDNTLSSYTWINLVIFYLQCIGFVPNLQCPKLMRDCNHEMGWGKSRRRQDNINNLNTAYLKWNGQADCVWQRSQSVDDAYASVSILLYGFFRFYAHDYPIHTHLVSIKRGGNVRLPKTMFSDRASLHLCIEDPFETYDSHFPHDLGVPADEAGSMLISKCFSNSEQYLREILFEGKDDDISKIDKLWPITVIETEASGRSARRNRNARAEIRDPQKTLVIEVPFTDYQKEELLKVFQPFADLTGSKLIGSSLVNGGKLAFVDYDSLYAVNAALAEHAKSPLALKGMVLQVRPKAVASKQLKTPKKEPKQKSPQKTPKKGDPDKTLVVQSISGAFSEKGIAKLFRPFAEQTKCKLLLVDVVKKKKKAFVEYNSPAAVQAALKEHAKNPLFWNGKPLEVSPKVAPGGGSKPKTPKKPQNTPKKKPAKKKAGSTGKPIITANESIQGQI